jgi:hypothetical protein
MSMATHLETALITLPTMTAAHTATSSVLAHLLIKDQE